MSRSEFYRVAARRLADELEREADFAARASAVIDSLAVDAWEAPLLQEQQRVFLEGSTWCSASEAPRQRIRARAIAL